MNLVGHVSSTYPILYTQICVVSRLKVCHPCFGKVYYHFCCIRFRDRNTVFLDFSMIYFWYWTQQPVLAIVNNQSPTYVGTLTLYVFIHRFHLVNTIISRYEGILLVRHTLVCYSYHPLISPKLTKLLFVIASYLRFVMTRIDQQFELL